MATYLKNLTDFLKTNFPQCIPMPTQVNGKIPLYKHKGVSNQTLWNKWDTEYINQTQNGLVLIIRDSLIVIDIDDYDYALKFEQKFPCIKNTSIQKTKHGFHYYFKRTTKCNEKKIYDKARSLKDANNNEIPLDIKTVCATGTGGIISIFPSPGKEWVHSIFEQPPIDLPDDILDFIIQHQHIKFTNTNANINNLNQVIQLLHICVSKTRADTYNDWVSVGMCLKNINPNLLDEWIIFSKQSNKFKSEEECIQKWTTFSEALIGSLTIGTLRMWAKEDNILQYNNLINNDYHELVYESLSGLHTDLAKVIHFLYKDEFVCTSLSKNEWYFFNGQKWELSQGALRLRIKMSTEIYGIYVSKSYEYTQAARKLTPDSVKFTENAKKCMDIANKFKSVKGKDAVNRECCEFFYDGNFTSKLDEITHLIGFDNGVYDFSTMQFRKGLPSDYISMTTGYDFDPNENMEIQGKLKEFMRSMQANEEMYQYLLNVSSYMLDGYKYLEYMWFLTGSGRNSKGVFTTLLTKTFGQYAYCPKVEILMDEKTSSTTGPSSEVAKMKGKRCIIASEPTDKEGVAFKVSLLKNLRGNDVIQARELYKEAMEFKPQFGIMIQMNDMPALDKVDHAFGSTLKVIRFPFTFCNEPKKPNEKPIDTTLKSLFSDNIAYRQQFMLILLDNYKKNIYGRQPLLDTAEVKAATQDYLDDNNQVGMWLNENIEITDNKKDRIRLSEMYDNFVFNTKSKCSIKMFAKSMNYNGLIAVKISVMVYTGVKFKDDVQLIDPDVIN